MKVKVGQRRFLLRNGYTDAQIDRMTAGTARSIISALEEKNRKAKLAEAAEDTDRLIQEMFATMVSEGCENPHALYAFCTMAINEGYRKVR